MLLVFSGFSSRKFWFESDSLDTWHSESNDTSSLPRPGTLFVDFKLWSSVTLNPSIKCWILHSFLTGVVLWISMFCPFGHVDASLYSYRVSVRSWSASLLTWAIIVDSAFILWPSSSQYPKPNTFLRRFTLRTHQSLIFLTFSLFKPCPCNSEIYLERYDIRAMTMNNTTFWDVT